MEKIKTVVLNNFTTIFYSILLLGTSLFLLMLRLKITHSFFLLFLVWNLFLAWIPFGISSILLAKRDMSKLGAFLGFGIWLLFLPNAPYIITDLIHLQRSSDLILWFDMLVIGSFALSGMYSYVCSTRQMRVFLKRHVSEKRTSILLFCTHFLCGFGIYLGRFLRWNSWDILQSPQTLFYDMLSIIIDPMDNKVAWATTIGFGIGLFLIQKFFRSKNLINTKLF